MTSRPGMVLLFEATEGDHIVHYYCEATDIRQMKHHRAAIPSGFELAGTTRINGFEYTPENGGKRFADLYRRSNSS
ncbi:hypothetical protein ACIQU6_34160 [Streptomyces sp. NPDC090442]|uniref:hypothetical protein n=1 Tax=Streptomyces sp. NPDC090442 TaxID=3365962 RepID=UPI0038236343